MINNPIKIQIINNILSKIYHQISQLHKLLIKNILNKIKKKKLITNLNIQHQILKMIKKINSNILSCSLS
jgi:hypothetical protein